MIMKDNVKGLTKHNVDRHGVDLVINDSVTSIYLALGLIQRQYPDSSFSALLLLANGLERILKCVLILEDGYTVHKEFFTGQQGHKIKVLMEKVLDYISRFDGFGDHIITPFYNNIKDNVDLFDKLENFSIIGRYLGLDFACGREGWKVHGKACEETNWEEYYEKCEKFIENDYLIECTERFLSLIGRFLRFKYSRFPGIWDFGKLVLDHEIGRTDYGTFLHGEGVTWPWRR
jgi:hypothetical protein